MIRKRAAGFNLGKKIKFMDGMNNIQEGYIQDFKHTEDGLKYMVSRAEKPPEEYFFGSIHWFTVRCENVLF